MEKILPEEMTIDILSRVPGESLLPSKRVCTTWRRLVRDTHFADKHLRCQLQQQQQQQLIDVDDEEEEEEELHHKRALAASDPSKTITSVDGDGAATATVTKVNFLYLAKSYAKSTNKSIYYGVYRYNSNSNSNDRPRLYHKILKKNRIIDQRLPSAASPNHLNPPIHAIVGSCNGFICFSVCHACSFVNNDPVYIVNPITGEEVNLPKFMNDNNNGNYQCFTMASGFGYLPSTNEYKVVRISYPSFQHPVGQVEVYTLGGGTGTGTGWRNIREISYSLLEPGSRTPSLGVLADGALHWLDQTEFKIVTFDLADEEFRTVPSPPCFRHEEFDSSYFHLQVLGGCLCFVHQKRGKSVDIWSLKKKKKKEEEEKKKQKSNDTSSYGRKEEQDQECYWHWTREFTIALQEGKRTDCYEPLALTKNGELLLLCNGTMFLLYNPKTAKLKTPLGGVLGLKVSQAIFHVNSFVSLKAKVDLGGRICMPR